MTLGNNFYQELEASLLQLLLQLHISPLWRVIICLNFPWGPWWEKWSYILYSCPSLQRHLPYLPHLLLPKFTSLSQKNLLIYLQTQRLHRKHEHRIHHWKMFSPNHRNSWDNLHPGTLRKLSQIMNFFIFLFFCKLINKFFWNLGLQIQNFSLQTAEIRVKQKYCSYFWN